MSKLPLCLNLVAGRSNEPLLDGKLCLDLPGRFQASEHLHPITQGEYAPNQIRHQGEFAVAGLRRTEAGVWEIDQIKGAKNAEPSQHIREHFLQWLAVANDELVARKTLCEQ